MARKSRRLSETMESGKKSENVQIYATAIYARLSVENSGKERRWKHRLLYVKNTSGLARICARPTFIRTTDERGPFLIGQRSTG